MGKNQNIKASRYKQRIGVDGRWNLMVDVFFEEILLVVNYSRGFLICFLINPLILFLHQPRNLFNRRTDVLHRFEIRMVMSEDGRNKFVKDE